MTTTRPIIFSGEMVRAILDGRKTQTRRVLKPDGKYRLALVAPADGGPSRCPYGQPGDRLWARETWSGWDKPQIENGPIFYRATDGHFCDGKQMPLSWVKREARWRPSSHMPRWASRITLEITGVRIERLQDISIPDAIAEGIVQTWGDFRNAPPQWACDSISAAHGSPGPHLYDNRTSAENYRFLWESLHGPGSWDANPWVWAISFRRLES